MNFSSALSTKNVISNIVSVDTRNNSAYLFSENSLKIKPLNKTDKNATNITTLKFKDLYNTRVQTMLEGSELENDIAAQTRKNLNLDEQSEFLIKYRIVDMNEYESYATSFDNLEIFLKDALVELKYIDYVIAEPFLFEALYANGNLSSDGAHCFLFLDKDDAFLALYQNGKFSLSRGLGRYNFEYLKTQYASATGINLDIEDFLKKLKNEGTSTDLLSVLDDMAYYISDLFNGISSLQNAGVSKVFVGSSIGLIPGLSQLISQRVLIDTKDFDFNKKIEGADLDPSCMNTLAYLYAKNAAKIETSTALNFSPFLRPPSFLKRDGGQFLAVTGVACILALILPVINLITAGYYFSLDRYENSVLEQRKHEVSLLEPEHKANEDNLKAQLDKIQKLEENIQISKRLIDDSRSKKLDYKARSEFLYDISNFISQANVYATNIKITNKDVRISLLSDKDSKITQLIENINNSIKYNITTKEIRLKESNDKADKNRYYESNITIGFVQ